MKIKNFEALATSPERSVALKIIEAGFEAIDTEKIISEKVRLDGEDLYLDGEKIAAFKNLYVFSIGKCGFESARAIENILKDKITAGIAYDVKGGELKKIKSLVGDHPYPNERNILATEEIIGSLSSLNPDDVVIFLISGGGSALLSKPSGLSHSDERNILKCLFDAGADIKKINTSRKHLSLARGGFLAKYAYPARVYSLIFSDVPGNDMGFVSSGPTVPDSSSVEDAAKVLADYSVKESCALNFDLIETPKEEKYFKNVKNILVLSNSDALKAMEFAAQELGFKTAIKSASFDKMVGELAAQISKELGAAPPKTALIYGGELKVILGKNPEKGGRNQELVMHSLKNLKESEIILAVASDGRDNTDFAGALGDEETLRKAEEKNIDLEKHLEVHSSYEFFKEVGDYVLTGITGSNVSDLVLAIKN